MKKPLALAIAALAFAVALPAAAQTAPDAAAIQGIRDQLRTDRKVVIEHNMNLTPDEAKKFWPVYEAFQRELAPVQSRSNRALLDYIAAESNMTDANAKRLMGQLNSADEAEAKLRGSYYAKFSKAVGAKKAARYLQIESKIRALERYDQAAAIPLVK